MIRIRTTIGEGRVFTLFFMGKWVTLMNDGKKSVASTDAPTLLEASSNHLAMCQRLKEIINERGRLADKLLHGTGHSRFDPDGVSGGDDGPYREGSDGDDREGRNEILSADSPGSQDEEPPQL